MPAADLTPWQAIVLGVLQGLAEFLPISSSAHLSLAPWAFGWPAPGLAFDVALHVGTLVALLWYFRLEWISLVRGAWTLAATRRLDDPAARRVALLVVATIPAAIAGLLLEDYAETVFRTPALTATMLAVMGGILWVADRAGGTARALGDLGWRDAALIGLAQCFALVPGVSRSGSTMTAGRLLGFSRHDAAVFSFLMSMPITSAAAILKVPEAVAQRGVDLPLVLGITASTLSSWLAITVLLRFVQRRSFAVFAWYRLALAAAVFALIAARG